MAHKDSQGQMLTKPWDASREQKMPTQSHISPSILQYTKKRCSLLAGQRTDGFKEIAGGKTAVNLNLLYQEITKVGGQRTETRAQGSGLRAQGPGSRVQGSGFRVQGSGFRVQADRDDGVAEVGEVLALQDHLPARRLYNGHTRRKTLSRRRLLLTPGWSHQLRVHQLRVFASAEV